MITFQFRVIYIKCHNPCCHQIACVAIYNLICLSHEGIRRRIGPPWLWVVIRVDLKRGGPSEDTNWTGVQCHSSYGTIKNPPYSEGVSAEKMPKNCNSSLTIATSIQFNSILYSLKTPDHWYNYIQIAMVYRWRSQKRRSKIQQMQKEEK